MQVYSPISMQEAQDDYQEATLRQVYYYTMIFLAVLLLVFVLLAMIKTYKGVRMGERAKTPRLMFIYLMFIVTATLAIVLSSLNDYIIIKAQDQDV
jgi:cytochrome bd-type quinol oxidase subunit 2